MKTITIGNIEFHYSEFCGEYQRQTIFPDEYENIKGVLVAEGYEIDETEFYSYFTKGSIKIYVERNY